jgi:hypothetical protein
MTPNPPEKPLDEETTRQIWKTLDPFYDLLSPEKFDSLLNIFRQFVHCGWPPDKFIFLSLSGTKELLNQPDKYLDFFQKVNPTDFIRREMLLRYLLSNAAPLYTHQQLENLIARFIAYLREERPEILKKGVPQNSFPLSPYLFLRLSPLYSYQYPHTEKVIHPQSGDYISTGYLSAVPLSFKLSEQSLENLKSERLPAVPAEVINHLEAIKNREFNDEKTFLEELKATIGEKQTTRYKLLILKHAFDPHEHTAAKEVIIPGFDGPAVYAEIQIESSPMTKKILLPEEAEKEKKHNRRSKREREKLFALKIAILEELHRAVRDKEPDTLWESCQKVLTATLGAEAAGFYLEQDTRFMGIDIRHPRFIERESAVHAGGLSDLFMFTGYVENELRRDLCTVSMKPSLNSMRFPVRGSA